jgi:hypothetical protein
MKDLFDSNAVYFIAYFVVMAAFGQYMILRKIADFIDNVKTAFTRAKKVVRQRQRATDVEVKATELVVQPDIKFKVNQKECEKQLNYIRQQRAVDAGMHDLTSKFHRKSTVK